MTYFKIRLAPGKYLIGQNFGGQNFQRTKFFSRQNFRHQVEFRQLHIYARGRGKQYFFRVNLQIQGAPFFSGVILCIET